MLSKFKVSPFVVLPFFMSSDRISQSVSSPPVVVVLLLSYAFSSELACIPDDGSAIAWFVIVTCFVAVFLRLFAKTTKDDDDPSPPRFDRVYNYFSSTVTRDFSAIPCVATASSNEGGEHTSPTEKR